MFGPAALRLIDARANYAQGMSVQAGLEIIWNGLNTRLVMRSPSASVDLYIPIAWYPLSTYSVVPVTFRASAESR